MRIVHVNPFYYPFLGGIEHRIHHISRYLSERHEVLVLTSRLPNTTPEEEMDGYLVRRLDSFFLNLYNPPYVHTSGLRKALRELEPDVVDFHYRWAGSYTRAVAGHRGPKVLTWHNAFGEGEGSLGALSKLNDVIFSRQAKAFDMIVCVSDFVMRDLASRGFPMCKLSSVPNGVETVPHEGREEDFILFVGRLVKTKGLPYLIEAMRGVDSKLVVCGKGPERERLESLTKKLGLEGKIEFLGGVDEERKQMLLSRCKIFVFPSVWESYGIAAAEAMSHGKPVIATNVGGLPEVVGDCGLLVPPRDERSLRDSIRALLTDDDLRRGLGRRAQCLAETYTWRKAAEAMERAYEELTRA